MELQALLELNLHTFTSDVEEITDQALKEEKMEIALSKLEEMWSAIVFVSSPYKEGSDVLLLAISEEDFELCVATLCFPVFICYCMLCCDCVFLLFGTISSMALCVCLTVARSIS